MTPLPGGGKGPDEREPGPVPRRGARSAAVFLDRDGTLIEEGPLIERPDQLVLLPGVPEAIRALRGADYRIVVVTNQSAIARGRLDHAQLDAIHAALRERLAGVGAPLDGIEYCPDAPDEEAERNRPEARRKPGAGMLLEAAAAYDLELERCWMVGDQLRDALAGRRAGCRGSLLVRTGRVPLPPDAAAHADGVFADLAAAARFILERTDRSD